MDKVRNRSLLLLLLVAACLAPPALANVRSGWLTQATDSPEEATEALPAPTESAPPPAPSFEAPSEPLPPDTSLTIEGSPSMAAITQSLVQAFQQDYPTANVTVVEQPAETALQNVQAGTAKLAAVGRNLSDEQRAQGLTAVAVSREKIAIIVGTNNPFTGQLEAEDFVNIFRGIVTNWSELGGPDLPIRLVDRPAESDTRASLGDYEIFGGDLSTGDNVTTVTADSTADVVEALGDNGISYAIASQVIGQDNVRVIAMHDTLPDNPQYPYSQPRSYIYLDSEPLPPEVEAFLALATAAEGQEAVAEAKAAEAADVAVADLPDTVSAMRPSGAGFVTGDRRGNLNFWQANGTEAGTPVPAHTGPVTALAFSSDGQRLISGGADGTLHFWDAVGTPVGEPINSGNGPVTSLSTQPDGSFISASSDGILQRWDSTGNPVGEPITGHTGAVREIAVSPDGSTLITASEDGTIRRWNVADGSPQGEPLTGHLGSVQALSLKPDGSFFSGGADGTIRQWDATGAPVGEPLSGPGPVNAIAINPDGTSVAIGDETGALQYLSGTGEPVGPPLTDTDAPVDDLMFTPDGQQLVVSTGAAPQLRDSTGEIIPIPESGASSTGEDAGFISELQGLWDRIQELPPQVLWLLPIAVLAILLLNLLRSFRQEEADLPEDDVAGLLPEADAEAPEDWTTTGAANDFTANDFSAEDFSTEDLADTDSMIAAQSPDLVAGLTAEEAADSLDKSLAKAKQTLAEGVSLGNAGRYQAALDRFNKAIEMADIERLKALATGTTVIGAGAVIARGLARRGTALANLGRPQEALQSLDRALEMNVEDAAAWIGKGNALVQTEQLDEALFSFDKAIELNSNLAAAWQGKGRALQKMGRDAEARDCFDKAESLGGINEAIPIALGTPSADDADERPPVSPDIFDDRPPSTPEPWRSPQSKLEITPEPGPDLSIAPIAESETSPEDAASNLPANPVALIGRRTLAPEPESNPDAELSDELLSAIADMPPFDPTAPESSDDLDSTVPELSDDLAPPTAESLDDFAPPTAESLDDLAPPTAESLDDFDALTAESLDDFDATIAESSEDFAEFPPATPIEPIEPLPDTSEADVPADLLTDVEALPSTPEVADPDAPLSQPVPIPPEVQAILAGDSDIPATEETAEIAGVADPMSVLFGDDPAMSMRPSTSLEGEDAILELAEEPADITAIQPTATPSEEAAVSDDSFGFLDDSFDFSDSSFDDLSAEMLGNLDDISADLDDISADLEDLSPDADDDFERPSTPQPPPLPNNPRINNEVDSEEDSP
ncbi:MAG: substrate-binding domain-containing protein [Leptolyngbyaceae cyanobacterium]